MSTPNPPDREMAGIVSDVLTVCISLATLAAAQAKGADAEYVEEMLTRIDTELNQSIEGLTRYVKRG